MKYDFDEETSRLGSGSVKWDIAHDAQVLPMWVADMDFKAAPAIQKAVEERAKQGIFGYTMVKPSYYEAIINWFANRHGWHIQPDWILYTTGVVPAIGCAIKALCQPGERVIIQSPVYNSFFPSIRNQGCEVVENALLRKGDTYVIDFEDFARKCADPLVTAFLLCNPHNPAGRVWTKAELEQLNDICERHGVRIISDEIHCELIMPGQHFTPFGTINSKATILNSPTKNFNIAGLQIANIICPDAETRRRIDRVRHIYELRDLNPFGPIALEAAYNDSGDWLEELNQYLFENYNALCEHFRKALPQCTPLRLEGTYLVWLDISTLGLTSDEATALLLEKGKVMVNSGTMYGPQTGQGYLRINIACQRKRMMEGLERITDTLAAYLSGKQK